MRAQTFVAPSNRVESARDLKRLRFSTSALIAGGEGAQAGDDGAGIGGGGVVTRLIANGEGPRVVCRRRVVLKQLFPTHGHGDVPLIYLKRPPKGHKEYNRSREYIAVMTRRSNDWLRGSPLGQR